MVYVVTCDNNKALFISLLNDDFYLPQAQPKPFRTLFVFVYYLPGGGYAEYVAVEEVLVMPAPDSLQLSDAAAIPEAWLTAYQLLHFLGRVESGDVVLIHAGGSGVGTALVQLSLVAGAQPYVTAGSEEKIKMAESLGAKGGFNYKTGDFSNWIESVTEGILVFIDSSCILYALHAVDDNE